VDLTGVGISDLGPFSTSADRKSLTELRWTPPEAAAAAVIGGGGSDSLVGVSLYGKFIGGSSYSTMLHHAADLAPFLDSRAAGRTLIAGDLNLNAQWSGSDASYNALERNILRTFTMWGLRDLLAESDVPSAAGCR
jgi:hypothetical protein